MTTTSIQPQGKQMQAQGRRKDNRRKLKLTVNTNHCRAELDTVQYVIDKNGYKETTAAGDGNILWYGLALRDHDIDVIRMRNSQVNRYPLMDVRYMVQFYILGSILQRKMFFASF